MERQKKASNAFKHWFESANRFFEAFNFYFQKGENDTAYYSNAAFELHQVTERFYAAILLVFTDYKLRIHENRNGINKFGRITDKTKRK